MPFQGIKYNLPGIFPDHQSCTSIITMPSTPKSPQLVTNPWKIQASSIGSKACELVHPGIPGRIYGLSSRGVFIKTQSRWLIFFSYETYPGPLTINAPALRQTDMGLSPGQRVEITFGRLSIPAVDLVVTTQYIPAWHPGPPAFPALSNSLIQERLYTAAEHINRSNGPASSTPLLQLRLSSGQVGIRNQQLPLGKERTLDLFQRPGALQSTAPLIGLLGAGPGLTPSGDDFVIGFLLALNRWKHILPPQENLEQINQEIVSAAYRKTTTLSANLIECAVQGMADQRLVAALDWLVSATDDSIQVIERLLSWGSSSGGDAFVGFAAALAPKSTTPPAEKP